MTEPRRWEGGNVYFYFDLAVGRLDSFVRVVARSWKPIYGARPVEQAVVGLSPSQAREVAAELVRRADEIEDTYRPPKREEYPEGSGPFGF